MDNNLKLVGIIGVIILILLGGVAYLSFPQKTPNNPLATVPEPTRSPSIPSIVEITDSGFLPQTVTTRKGTPVKVTNETSSVVEISLSDNSGQNFKVQPQDSVTLNFTKFGEYSYVESSDRNKMFLIIIQ